MSKRGGGGAKRASNTTLNPKAALKVEHLQTLALWTGGEASIPSLATSWLLLKRLWMFPPDPSLVSCQRCETILQPGFNCTIRIEKNRAKARRRSKKPANFTFTQNNVVYTCHFCSERNVKRGTSCGHMKAICPLKIKKASNLKPSNCISQKFVTSKKSTAGEEDKVGKLNIRTPTVDEEIPTVDKFTTSSTIDEEMPTVDSPTTTMVKPVFTLLDSKRKMRNKSASKKRSEPENSPAPADAENSVSTTNKRRRKSWTSLKELAERNEQKKNISTQEDPVLLTPSGNREKPYVAIIKDITQLKDGNMVVLGQWFYRPEEAEKKGGGNWQSQDTRELFYSFHRDECPAESVMHKCVVHFVPLHKQLPKRKEHPGFIVQKVYDTDGKKLWKLTDRDYEEDKQHEIDLLVQKTMRRLVDLPDIEIGDPPANQDDQLKSKRNLIKKNIAPLDVSRLDEATTRPGRTPKAETPASCLANSSEYHHILVELNALSGDAHRDKWLEKLVKELQFICSSAENMKGVDKRKSSHETDCKSPDNANGLQDTNLKGGKPFQWPDDAVRAAVSLEKTTHDSLSSDFQKYNQKVRSLLFNLSRQAVLARRLLSGELEPLTILNMSPDELKEGLTAEERAMKEPDESERMQMTDARCTRCSELKVGVRNIIQAGHGARYELECIACGHQWYAARDAVSMLTIDTPSSNQNVGTVPSATAKFEDVEKKLVSPRASDTAAATETLKKTTEAYMPVLEAQRSFGKLKREEKSESEKNAE